MIIRPLVVAVALMSASVARADLHDFTQSGTVSVDAGVARSATLHVGCSPDRDGGALVVELIVTQANTLQDFDYNEFEGPDAPAGNKPLSHVTWTSSSGNTETTHAAAGSYLPEPAESFMFGIDQLSRRRGPAATVLAGVGSAAGQLVWTQSAYDKSNRHIVAKFDLDAAAAQRLHDAVAVCLPTGK
jgi:hypothetical protein